MIAAMEWSSESVSTSAAHSSASARLRTREGAPRVARVLLATDMSPASAGATREAITLAVQDRAQLIVLSVVDPRLLRLPGGLFVRRVDQERTRVEAAAQAIVVRAHRAGATATFLVWEGDPAEAILEAA